MPTRTPRLLLCALLAVAAVAGAPVAADAASTTWLCRPGLAEDPCTGSLATTRFSPNGQALGTSRPRIDRRRPVDCFYVYPTVSDEPGVSASLAVRPEIRSIARFQAARFAQHCRIYAPLYRQITLAGLRAPAADQQRAGELAYADVRAAFRSFLRRIGSRRGFVLIGHSQGSFHLRRLVREEIDRTPPLRRRLVSAVLLGGNVLVRRGRDAGGDFRHVRACRRSTQTGCVVAYSTYDADPPADALFGRTGGRFGTDAAGRDLEVLCTNPGRLRGGSARLDVVFPSEPFAPGTAISLGIGLLGLPLPQAATPWISMPGSFTARCSHAAGASVLRVQARGGLAEPKPSPDPTWGLHLMDVNVALGDLTALVGRQIRAYERPRS